RSAPCSDASFSWLSTEATMREQRHCDPFSGHQEASCGRCDGSRAGTSFDLSFALVIAPAFTIRDDVVRRIPVIAHRTALGTMLIAPSYISLDGLSHGGFTRSAAIEHHPGWQSLL